MNEKLKFEIATICLSHIISIIFALIFMFIFYYKMRNSKAIKPFIIMQINVTFWLFFKILKTVACDVNTRWNFILCYYLFICLFEASFFEFAYTYYYKKYLNPKIKKILYCLALFQISLILTNPIHHKFYATYDFWDDSFGPLFYLHTAIEYTIIALSIWLWSKKVRENLRHKSTANRIIAFSFIVLPIIFNFLYISKILQNIFISLNLNIVFDITPISLVISTSFFLFTTIKYELIDLSPIMQNEIIDKLDTSIAVFDKKFTCIYLNDKCKSILGFDAGKKISKSINLKQVEKQSIANHKISREIQILGSIYMVNIIKAKRLNKYEYIMILNDIDEYRKSQKKLTKEQEELNKSNLKIEEKITELKNLSKASAVDFIARELHDIIGHSLVITIKLLEVARIYKNKNKKLAKDAIKDAISSIDSGIESIEKKYDKSDIYKGYDLEKKIRQILKNIGHSGINTHLKFKGQNEILEEKKYTIIVKICMELLTNTIKHADAKDFYISISIDEESIEIVSIDNGKGNEDFKAGNGLKGIAKRLSLIGGRIECNSSKNEGFVCKIYINKK